MDEIKQQIDRLTELSDSDLSELEGSILSEFDNIEQGDVTEESVASMTELADALDVVRAEIGTRDEKSQALFAAKEAAVGRVKASRPEDKSDVDAAAAPVSDGENVADEASVAASAAETVEASGTVDKKDESQVEAETVETEAPVEVEPAKEASPPPEAKTVESSLKEAGVNDPVNSAPSAPLRDTTFPPDPATQTPVSETNDVSTPPMEGVEKDAVTSHLTDETAIGAEKTDAKHEHVDVTEAANVKPAGDDETDTNEKETTVTASGEPDITPPADRMPAPKVNALEAPVVITAGADIPGVSAGSELPDMKAVAASMSQRMHAMRRTSGGDGEQHTVASLVASFPEERVLRGSEQEQNARKIEAATDSKALVAAGGICAPVAVRYDLFELGGLGRPVRDSLPSFNADRGGIRYVTPPTLSDFTGAVALWTLQDDIDAATDGAPNPVKPCIRVECGDEVVVMIDAITLCLTFGNMGARAYPELVRRNNELGLIQHARFAETRLLTRIGTLSTPVSAGRVLGAARDYFNQVERAAAAYRSRHRMDDNAPLRIIAPTWLKNMLRSDLVMQMPGDGNDDTFALAEATINRWFSVRNVNVTWAVDGEAGQIFGAQAAGALLSFPDNVIWYLFAEGTFLFLDGGTLDLGLVRDSTLNGTNDYKMFLETFEGVAKVGIESLRITSRLEATGAVAGTVDTSALNI